MTTTKMTPEELMNHARKCYEMSQLAIFLNSINPSLEMAKAIQSWRKAGKRAEYRADCIWAGEGDPALYKQKHRKHERN